MKRIASALTLISALLVLLITLLLVASVPSLQAVTEASQMQWSKTYGIPNFEGKSVIQTNDGGFLILAESVQNQNTIIKTDSEGNLLWEKTIQINGSITLSSVIQSQNGGYALAGNIVLQSYESGCLIKVDENGNVEWSRIFPFYYLIFPRQVDGGFNSFVQTIDGGYALVGQYSMGEPMYGNAAFTYFVKTDADGNLQLNETVRFSSGTPYGPFYPVSIVQKSDGAYVIIGGFPAHHYGGSSFEVVELNSNGVMQWYSLYPSYNQANYASCGIATNDSGYIIGGSSSSGDGSVIGLLVKTNYQGNAIWNETFNEVTNIQTIAQTIDGRYVFSSGEGLFQIDSNGKVESNFTLVGVANAVVATMDGGFALTGQLDNTVWLVKFAPESAIPPDETSPFPTTWIVISVIVAAVVGIGLLVYFKKRRS
jgi:hypothetical protein